MRTRSRAALSTRIALSRDLEGDALGLERGDDLAGGGGVEPGIEQRQSRRGRDAADAEDRRDDRERR